MSEPRRAFPPVARNNPSPAVRHSPQANVQAPAPRAPSQDIENIQRSLDTLATRINAIPKPQPNTDHSAAQAMQRAMQEEMRNGFQQIRNDLAQTQNADQHLGNDLKRISDGIASLQNSSNVHPDYVEQMQVELSNLHNGLDQLLNKAPETQIDLSGVSRSIETGYSDIVNKLDAVLTQRGNELPAIEIPDYSKELDALHARLEEVTRAVVSISVSSNEAQDTHAIERIEARLASLAKSVDDISEAGAGATQPFDGSSIAAQITQLSEKLDNTSTMNEVGSHIFADVQGIASRLDTLQNEFGVLASSLENRVSEPAPIGQFDTSNLNEIEQRLAGLADRFDATTLQSSDVGNGSSQEILSTLRDLVSRVEGIEHQAHQPVQSGDDEQFMALQNQLTSISDQLGTLQTSDNGQEAGGEWQADLTPITERLDHIEGQIAASRDIVIDIATEAAQKAAAEGSSGPVSDVALASILDELREMRDQQSQAYGASQAPLDDGRLTEIGQTMQAIAARLQEIEAVAPVGSSYQTNEPAAYAAPIDVELPSANVDPYQGADEYSNPAENVDHAHDAYAAQEQDAYVEPQAEMHAHVEDAPSLDMSFDAGDASSDIEPEVATEYVAAEADQTMEATAGEGEDVPLAPGSGMPDLEALVRRATQKKKGKAEETEKSADEESSTSDLLAAARRAAQAASLEAKTEKDKPAKKKSARPSLPKVGVPSFVSKKSLMMTAAVAALAVGGFVLGPKLLGSSPQQTSEVMMEADQSAGEVDLAAGQTTLELGATDETETAEAPLVMGEAEPSNDGSSLLSPEPVAQAKPSGFESTQSDAQNTSVQTEEPVEENSTLSLANGSGMMPPEAIGNEALLKAAAAGDGDALFETARRFTDGQGVERDLSEAIKWYRLAADNGHVPAQYRLGNFYEKGHGVETNPAEAAKWYAKAAAKGNALAMHNLAVLNAMGVVGGDADMDAAISWFEKAADLGVKDSQVNLGILYTKGMGVEEDLEKAYKWFAIAAKGGDNDAAKKRDTVAQAMRPEQLEKARGTAEIWQPAKLDASANVATVKDEWKSGTPATSASLSKEEIVKRTQMLLSKAGFDAGAADGQFGKRTRNAIISFQKKMGVKADGQITPDLLKMLTKVSI